MTHDDLWAALDEPDRAVYRAMRAENATHIDAPGIEGVQARFHPAFEAFMLCFAHEARRLNVGRSTSLDVVDGCAAVLAKMSVNIVRNLAVDRPSAMIAIMQELLGSLADFAVGDIAGTADTTRVSEFCVSLGASA